MYKTTADGQKFLADVLERSGTDEITSMERRRTRPREPAVWFSHDRLSAPVGNGQADWARANDAIRLWRAHHRAGIVITMSSTAQLLGKPSCTCPRRAVAPIPKEAGRIPPIAGDSTRGPCGAM